MLRKQKISVLVILALFLWCLPGWAGSGTDDVRCVPEQPYQIEIEKGEVSSRGTFGVPRNQVLLEIVTDATGWPFCDEAAVAADSLEKLKGDSLAVLEYHIWDPLFENTDAYGRKDYYGISGTPTGKINGRRTCVGGGSGTFNCYQGAYSMEMVSYSPCSLRVDVLYDSTSRFIKVKTWVTAIDTFPNANAHLRYAIAESHKYYVWQGLDSLHHIVRKMLPNYNGVAFSIDPGEMFADSQTYTLDPTWVARNCYVVVFVQADDYTYKNVFRSGKAYLFPTYVFGDCTRDSIVDVADIVFEINYLYKGGESPNPYGRGDPNRDCIVDVADIVYLINYLYKDGPAPLKGCD